LEKQKTQRIKTTEEGKISSSVGCPLYNPPKKEKIKNKKLKD